MNSVESRVCEINRTSDILISFGNFAQLNVSGEIISLINSIVEHNLITFFWIISCDDLETDWK